MIDSSLIPTPLINIRQLTLHSVVTGLELLLDGIENVLFIIKLLCDTDDSIKLWKVNSYCLLLYSIIRLHIISCY
jgi:hypothetical protein